MSILSALLPKPKATTGFEAEFFIVDKKTGRISPGADDILKHIPESAKNIVDESSMNLIEVGSYPDVDGADTMTNFMQSLTSLLYVADERGYALVPLGTYPGVFVPEMRKSKYFKAQQLLHGERRVRISGRCAGYHCHNSLPDGVVDIESLTVKGQNTIEQTGIVDAYNLLVALDPAIATFMQSSPFYQGRQFAKDSRMIVYRGGDVFGALPENLVTNFSHFGELPRYEYSLENILQSIERRFKDRMEALEAAGVAPKDMPSYPSKLSANWSPVKINPHGTFEQRGMDMNHLPLLLSTSVVIWRLLHHVRQGHYRVIPDERAIDKPFKFDGKSILIPPEAHVRERLQKLSALRGLESDEVFLYCSRLVDLVKKLDGKQVDWLLKPLVLMLEERQTTSDKILAQAKKLGYEHDGEPLPQRIAAEIVKLHSKQMFEDIVLLRQMIEENERLVS